MAKINFPKNENNFDAWFTNFQQAFSANAREFGFTTNDVKTVNQFFKAWQTWMTTLENWNEFNTSFAKFQNAQFNSFQTFVMGYWNEIVTNPSFDGDVQEWFGTGAPRRITGFKTRKTITNRKTATTRNGRTKVTANGTFGTGTFGNGTYTNGRTTTNGTTKNGKATKTTTRGRGQGTTSNVPNVNPVVWFSSFNPGRVNVYVGNTVNGGFSLPTGATGAVIQYRYGRQSWRKLTEGANFPFAHVTGSIDAKKITYRACWIYGNKKGPWSPTANFEIATAKAA